MNGPDTTFAGTGRDPAAWRDAAERRKRASEVLWEALARALPEIEVADAPSPPDAFLFEDYLLECGLALENLVKGIIVGRNPEIVGESKLDLSKWRGGEHAHDLSYLATTVLPRLSEEDQDFLRRASEAVSWVGRYPIPTKAAALSRTSDIAGHTIERRSFLSRDPETFASLYRRLDVRIVKEMLPHCRDGENNA